MLNCLDWSQYGGKCYKVFEQKLSYADSAALCKRFMIIDATI